MKKTKLIAGILLSASLLVFNNCKKSSTTSTDSSSSSSSSSSDKKYALVIDNGAVSVDVTKSITFSAHLVSSTGAIINPSGITWSSNIGGLTGSTFMLTNDTTGIVSASVQYEGQTYSASVPVCVQPLNNTQVFEVVPSAIIWSTNSGDIQLNTVYFGTSAASYAFSSDDASIASVSSSGLISFKKVGNTRIKVTGTINGKSSVFVVPVMVVGEPEVPLPVTRVVVTPAMYEMFRGEKMQLSAKAYNSKGEDVSSTVTFNYLVVPKVEEDEDPNSTSTPTAISVSATGEVSAKLIGSAYVKVTAAGLQAQSEIIVNPDTVLMVTPFYVNLGGMDYTAFPPVPNPTSVNLNATTYKVDRTAYRAKNGTNYLNVIPNPSSLLWDIPLTGVPEVDNLFNFLTLSNKTNSGCTATLKSNATPGMATFVIAHSGDLGGVSTVISN